MKRKKINKAIKALRKFCNSHPDDCSFCPFRSDGSTYCSLETIPTCWKTLKKEKNNEDY
jgi:hypothetical protein